LCSTSGLHQAADFKRSSLLEHKRFPKANSKLAPHEVDLATEAEAAKAEPQNVRAQLSRILSEPKPKKYCSRVTQAEKIFYLKFLSYCS